ncbi:MAG: DUF2851 family protein [Kiritimatiellia bacterium]
MKSITERHVQAIWYDSALRPKHLTTCRGQAVAVVSPGEWNLGAGPDFRRAVLEIGRERRRVSGDVEIHLCPSDWDFHRHGADPNYRNVIAHVTWNRGPEPATLPPGAESIWIGRFVRSDATFSAEQIDLMAYPYARLPLGVRPCAKTIGGNPGLAREILSEAGRHRLRMKARRLAGRLGACGGDCRQLFYEEVMSALGYRRNQVQFRHVARRVPIGELSGDGAAARAMMLTAGSFEDWDRAGCRPHNAPERRLENAAKVFTRTQTMSLASATDFSPEGCREMVRMICGDGFVGRGRAAAIVANVVVPFALAAGRVSGLPGWLPPEDLSEPVRLAAFRFFGRDHYPAAHYATNGLLIQGLLQVNRDYCLQVHPDCEDCGLIRNVACGSGGDARR